MQAITDYRRLARTTAGSHLLLMLYTAMCAYVSLSPSVQVYPLLSPSDHKFAFYILDSTSALSISSFVSFFLRLYTYMMSHDICLCLTHCTQDDSL